MKYKHEYILQFVYKIPLCHCGIIILYKICTSQFTNILSIK